jgi:acyl-coenzyme A synthetase/AMP-(fatty) acid ligase
MHPSATHAAGLAAGLADFGDRTALIHPGGALTYTELALQVDALAARLGTCRRLVLIECRRSVESVVAYLAALAGGHAAVLVGADQTQHVEGLVDAYDPDVVVRGGSIDERREGTVHDLHSELALLLSTSGSTGSPKLVRLSHDNLQANAEAIAGYLGIRDTDRAITTLPMQYCYGLSVINSHLLRGAALVLTELSVVDQCFWDLVRRHRVSSFAGVPYTFDQLDRIGFERMQLPSLRYVTQAGGRLAPSRVRRYAELGRHNGWDLVVMYGQTEATARMAYLPPDLAFERPELIGVPVPGGAFRLEPVEGAPPGVGELIYTGRNVMLGYAETADDLALGRIVDELRTGDLARRTPDGLFEVVGRQSRFAKVFGLRIDLAQVESVLEDEDITAACADGGSALVVAVEAGADRVQHIVGERFGLPACAVRVCRVASIPRLTTGKPDYGAVAKLGEERSCASSASPTSDLRRLYGALLGREDVTDQDSFVSLGGDSLSYVEMSIRLEDSLGHLPSGWHLMPIADLVARPWRRLRQVETNVLLRALAIVFVVGSHTNLFGVTGGAHVLLGIAGYNLARFHLTSTGRRERVRRVLASTSRIAVPSMIWIGLVAVLGGGYGVANVLLLNGVLGPRDWSEPEWHFWFVEGLVYTLLAVAALLTLPTLDRAERRWPFWLPLGLVGAGLWTRFDLVPLGDSDRIHAAPVVFWLFALGWAAARASTVVHRLLVSLVLVATVPGFFGDPAREGVVVAGLLMLVWVPSMRVPQPVGRLAGALAAGSLYVYLTHWQVYPWFEVDVPLLGLVASLAVGLAYQRAWRWLTPRWAACPARQSAPHVSGLLTIRRGAAGVQFWGGGRDAGRGQA